MPRDDIITVYSETSSIASTITESTDEILLKAVFDATNKSCFEVKVNTICFMFILFFAIKKPKIKIPPASKIALVKKKNEVVSHTFGFTA